MITFSRLRTVNHSDVEEIQRLIGQLTRSRQRLTGVAVRRALTQGGVFVLVARDRKKIVGMGALVLACVPSGCFAEIEDVVVDEAYRGQGIGRKIMERLIVRARRQRVEFIELTSRPSRVAANKLYQKLGFKKRKTNVYRLVAEKILS